MLSRAGMLLIVDPQVKLMPAIERGEAVKTRILALLDGARFLNVKVQATEHCADRIGKLEPEIRGRLLPSEILAKTHFAAGPENGLSFEEASYIICGAETHVCVLQTALVLLEAGKRVAIVADAVGSRHVEDRRVALDRLSKKGAEIVTTEMVLFEWLQHADDPAFRAVLKLIKPL
jgi:nicotinamidase-related amidase